jgi:chitinase
MLCHVYGSYANNKETKIMGKTKIVALSLAFFIVLSLIACSSSLSTNTPEASTNEATSFETSTAAFQITKTLRPTITPTPGEPGFCEHTGALDGKQLLIGYIPDYRSLDPTWGNCLTDIIYSSIDFFPDGSLDTEHINYANLTTMQEIKEKYGTRIHISIGGMNRSENFNAVVTDIQNRDRFVKNLIDFAEEYNLDGIDLDWEFPVTQEEIRGYTITMSALQKKGLIVSVALYPYDDFNVKPYFTADRILIMSYERGKQHSTYEQAVKDLVHFSLLDVPREKLYLGIPMYGRQMDSPYQYFSYTEIMDQYGPLPNHVNEVENIYFNNTYTVERKTCYVIENGYAGVMLWELGQDNGDLLKTINQAIVSGCE